MIQRISLRWQLTLFAWSLAVVVGLLLIALLLADNRRDLLRQMDRTLETKCDEVITLLERGEPFASIEQFFAVETSYRFSPVAYFYQISDATGRLLARSGNLGDAALGITASWHEPTRQPPIGFESQAHPLAQGQKIRVRSERVEVDVPGVARPLLIQTAGSLEPLETAVATQVWRDLSVAAGSLAAVLLLLWFAISRALQPIGVMVGKASAITASNLKDRLPARGTGDELDDLARVINGMLDRLAASFRQTEAFASDASHQVRTRLTRMRGELDLLLRSAAGDPLRHELQTIQTELEELSKLCSRLLLLAQLDRHLSEQGVETGAIRLDALIDLDELVAELVEQVAPLARENQVELLQGPAAAVSIRGNRSLLLEALLNLLDNAIRFAAATGGSVTVSTELGTTDVRVAIVDSGPGIPPEERAHIFERFYRSPTAPSDSERSGLGLAIARRIAEAHGGRVEVAGRPDAARGCVFSLVFERSGA